MSFEQMLADLATRDDGGGWAMKLPPHVQAQVHDRPDGAILVLGPRKPARPSLLTKLWAKLRPAKGTK